MSEPLELNPDRRHKFCSYARSDACNQFFHASDAKLVPRASAGGVTIGASRLSRLAPRPTLARSGIQIRLLTLLLSSVVYHDRMVTVTGGTGL